MIWKRKFTLEDLAAGSQNTLSEYLGMEYTEIGDDYIKAQMPVDHRTVQPMRLLHGGASAALAETLGSVAGLMCIAPEEKKTVVGIELNCSHLRSATKGFVTGTVKPIRIGRKLQVWEIKIAGENDKMICVSRLTIMVVDL